MYNLKYKKNLKLDVYTPTKKIDTKSPVIFYDWAKKNAQRYNLDVQNIGLLGESAGAQIAMMISFLDNVLISGKYGKTNFTFLIDLYGPCDLIDIYNGPIIKNINNRLNKILKITSKEVHVEQFVFGFDPSKDSIRAKDLLHQYSPINFLAKNNFPTLIIHGKEDQMV